MSIVYLGFGSNLGDRKENCRRALRLLGETVGIVLTDISPLYETVAVTLPGEILPDFVNGVCRIETTQAPVKLYQTCKAIEEQVGRKPVDRRWQSRVIDLDILFYDDLILETEQLRIPHAELHLREFVLQPLNDIAPALLHPVLKMTISQLLWKTRSSFTDSPLSC